LTADLISKKNVDSKPDASIKPNTVTNATRVYLAHHYIREYEMGFLLSSYSLPILLCFSAHARQDFQGSTRTTRKTEKLTSSSYLGCAVELCQSTTGLHRSLISIALLVVVVVEEGDDGLGTFIARSAYGVPWKPVHGRHGAAHAAIHCFFSFCCCCSAALPSFLSSFSLWLGLGMM
jgi:hypothetical protein